MAEHPLHPPIVADEHHHSIAERRVRFKDCSYGVSQVRVLGDATALS
jgi:hypothetical protein